MRRPPNGTRGGARPARLVRAWRATRYGLVRTEGGPTRWPRARPAPGLAGPPHRAPAVEGAAEGGVARGPGSRSRSCPSRTSTGASSSPAPRADHGPREGRACGRRSGAGPSTCRRARTWRSSSPRAAARRKRRRSSAPPLERAPGWPACGLPRWRSCTGGQGRLGGSPRRRSRSASPRTRGTPRALLQTSGWRTPG